MLSYRIPTPKDLEKLLGKPLHKTIIGLIPNSKDYYAEKARNVKLHTFTGDFDRLGISSEIVDLRDYNDKTKLKTKLATYDALWACGGNMFCLRYEMKRSGFDQIIKDLVKGGLVFCGDSAGAIIAGPSLKGSESADNPEFAEDIIWEGLNLIPDFIMPHVNSDTYRDVLRTVRALHADGENYIELNDWEAVVFNDGKKEIVSSKN